MEDNDTGAAGAGAVAVCGGGLGKLFGGAVVLGSCSGTPLLEGVGCRGAHRRIACDAVRPCNTGQCAAGGPGGGHRVPRRDAPCRFQTLPIPQPRAGAGPRLPAQRLLPSGNGRRKENQPAIHHRLLQTQRAKSERRNAQAAIHRYGAAAGTRGGALQNGPARQPQDRLPLRSADSAHGIPGHTRQIPKHQGGKRRHHLPHRAHAHTRAERIHGERDARTGACEPLRDCGQGL